MEFEENSKYIQAAKEQLAKKTRKEYYYVTVVSETHLEDVDYLENFTDEELQALLSLRNKYGKKEFVKHLDEVQFDDYDLIDIFTDEEIVDIDLDFKSYKYEFGRHELHGDKLIRYSTMVNLSDKSYIKLLALCLEDQSMNINKLKYADETIHSAIMREIDGHLCDDDFFCGSYPYLVTMDEVFADVEQILKVHPELQRDQTGCTGYFFRY